MQRRSSHAPRIAAVIAVALACAAWAQDTPACACGKNPPGPPAPRSLKPYTGAPEDLRPFSKFTTPYHEYYQDLIEYNGAAREIPDPDLNSLSEIRIGFLAPLYDHPDQVRGAHMLNGAQMAIDEANAARRLRRQAFPSNHSQRLRQLAEQQFVRCRRLERFRNLGRGLERCRSNDL